MERLLDSTGAAWPDYPRTCTVCNLPADPSLNGAAHPGCSPARVLDQTEVATALRLLLAELGATPYRPLNIWRKSGLPVNPDRPVIPAPRSATSDTRTETSR